MPFIQSEANIIFFPSTWISINSNKSYFDTNITEHHHFFDEDTNELIDCSNDDIDSVNVKKNSTGKKIKSIEVLIKVATDNQNQK